MPQWNYNDVLVCILWVHYHLTEKSSWGVESITVSDLPVYCRNATSITFWIQKKGRICVAWVWNWEGTEKLVNGKQHSICFIPTWMKGLPQKVLLNFRLEFLKSDLTINTFHSEFPKFYVKWYQHPMLGKIMTGDLKVVELGHDMILIWIRYKCLDIDEAVICYVMDVCQCFSEY